MWSISFHAIDPQSQVHIDKRYLVDGIFDIVAAQTVMRGGYHGDYISVTEIFELLRPEATPGTG